MEAKTVDLFENAEVIAEMMEEGEGPKLRTAECVGYSDDKQTFWPVPIFQKSERFPPGVYQLLSMQGVPIAFKVEKPEKKVVSSNKLQKQILAKIKAFVVAGPKYKALKFPHKRGFLLHGKHGCGKTTVLHKIFDLITGLGGICILYNGRPAYFRIAKGYISELNPGSPIVVVMEDIDRWLPGGEEELLDMLDGSFDANGVLFVATTNNFSRLPQRLIRKSRFDELIQLDEPDELDRRAFIESKLTAPQDVEALLQKTKNMSYSDMKEAVIQYVVFNNAELPNG